MPVYLYECEIHKEFEIQQSINDLPLEKCPKCEEEKIENSSKPKKLISSTSFILIGGGWASEGYK